MKQKEMNCINDNRKKKKFFKLKEAENPKLGHPS